MWKGVIGLVGLLITIGLPLYAIHSIAEWDGDEPEDLY